jgi:hypothetical protein
LAFELPIIAEIEMLAVMMQEVGLNSNQVASF